MKKLILLGLCMLFVVSFASAELVTDYRLNLTGDTMIEDSGNSGVNFGNNAVVRISAAPGQIQYGFFQYHFNTSLATIQQLHSASLFITREDTAPDTEYICFYDMSDLPDPGGMDEKTITWDNSATYRDVATIAGYNHTCVDYTGSAGETFEIDMTTLLVQKESWKVYEQLFSIEQLKDIQIPIQFIPGTVVDLYHQ